MRWGRLVRTCVRSDGAFLVVLYSSGGLHGWHVNCMASENAASPRSRNMALPFGETSGARDSRALAILAKSLYRELRNSGYEARDVIAVAGELLAHVTNEVSTGKSK